nr:amidohydrolase family protein [uncultured Pseudodesulfovibrio sp.]
MFLTRRDFLTSLIGLGAIPAPLSFAKALPTKTFALVGRIIIGDGSLPLNDHAILIDNGLIEAIVPAKNITDRPVLNLPYSTILPGIINAHCHRIHTSTGRRKRWLMHGVTAIGDVGSPLDAMPQLANSPSGFTATASFSGPMLTPPGGYPLPVHDSKYALIVKSSDDARKVVSMLVDHGATMIKFAFEPGVLPKPWPQFDAKTVSVLCNTARQQGLTIRCHVEDFSGLEKALNAGVHTVEHVPHRWRRRGHVRPILTSDNKLIDQYITLLERMKKENVILTPTLDVLCRSPWQGASLFEPVRIFHTMGGRIAVGNDYPYKRTEAGMPLREMNLLSKTGMSPLAVIQAATNVSAAACGFTDRGTLFPGMVADMIVVRGNPALGLEKMDTPTHVIKNGEFVR